MKRKRILPVIGNKRFIINTNNYKKILSFIKNNYFLLIIIGCLVFVGLIVFYKVFIVKPTYIYAKIKVGQGMWWATTQRPNYWFVKALQKAKTEKLPASTPNAKIVDISYYPYYNSSQYDVYVTAKLKVDLISKTNTYNFNRETIGISSPVELDFPNVQFTGTITELSKKPIEESYIEKTVYLTKKYSYLWEFDEIKIGDVFTNEDKTIFQILDKTKGETNEVFVNDQGKFDTSELDFYRYIILKTKMRVKKVDNLLLYAEEIIISPGRTIGVTTDNSVLTDYTIAKIE